MSDMIISGVCEDVNGRYMREFRTRAANPTINGLTGGAEWKDYPLPR